MTSFRTSTSSSGCYLWLHNAGRRWKRSKKRRSPFAIYGRTSANWWMGIYNVEWRPNFPAAQFTAMRHLFAHHLAFASMMTRLVSTASISSVEISGVVPKAPLVPNNCFPALGFKMPRLTPHDSELKDWWCDPPTEYAFVGFSYEVTACKLV